MTVNLLYVTYILCTCVDMYIYTLYIFFAVYLKIKIFVKNFYSYCEKEGEPMNE